jgi:hypothetical protein
MTSEREGEAELEENLEGIAMKARAAWDDDWHNRMKEDRIL